LATHQVNLDAMIPREDFDGAGSDGTNDIQVLCRADDFLDGRPTSTTLRKPDFQRDTNNWSPRVIVDFVKSYLDNEMIPPILKWTSQNGRVFIIDGAHRVSALIAWVHNDYGYGHKSKKFFGDAITEQQKILHTKTQELVEEEVGSFSDLSALLNDPSADHTKDQKALVRARRIGRFIPAQNVNGDASHAERSFLKINDRPAVIDKTELDVIRARDKPNAIATRSIMRAGSSHPALNKFPAHKDEIESLALEIRKLVFGPYEEIVTHSPDIPRAGQPYSSQAFNMVLDIINRFNGVTDAMWRSRAKKTKTSIPLLPDETDGSKTVAFLKTVRKVARLMASHEEPMGLGLDNAVYAWGETSQFYPSAHVAAMQFVRDIDQKGEQRKFKDARELFEDFLVRHKSYLKQLSHGKGARGRSVPAIVNLFRTVFEAIANGATNDDEIIKKVRSQQMLKDLRDKTGPVIKTNKKKFSKKVIAAGVVRDVLEHRPRCAYCNSRLPPHARSKEHEIPKRRGGKGTVENLGFVHPVCNRLKDEDDQNGGKRNG
jgi:5-methylcytosine-specific restriction endonuclease McrA